MITGTISNRRAYVSLLVKGAGGQEGDVEFLLDTGFTGMLTLPPTACQALGLPQSHFLEMSLLAGFEVCLQVIDGGRVTIQPL